MITNDFLNFKYIFQIDNTVTFHVRPVNEYDPEFTGNLDITITEVGFSCSLLSFPANCPVRLSGLKILHCKQSGELISNLPHKIYYTICISTHYVYTCHKKWP